MGRFGLTMTFPAVLLSAALSFAQQATTTPLATELGTERSRAIEHGVRFLLRRQNSDGSWGSARNTKDLNIYAPVPGAHDAFRTAVTSLCICALLEAAADNPEAIKGVDRGEEWLLRHLPRLRRATPDALYNVWGHGYSIMALVRLRERAAGDDARLARIDELIRDQFDLLSRYESVDGGWGYYDFRAGAKRPATDSISFTTAAILIAFFEAKRAGLEPPAAVVQRGIDSIVRQRKPDFSYLYGEYLKYWPMMPINRPGGSLGRSQVCNLALRQWGDTKINDEVLTTWLDRLFDRNGWLDIGRKRPIPHESHFQVAGYFFYFGHYYAALCIEELPEPMREAPRRRLSRILIDLQEKDGSWWDYPLYDYHQQYGTAFALLSLAAGGQSDEVSVAAEPSSP